MAGGNYSHGFCEREIIFVPSMTTPEGDIGAAGLDQAGSTESSWIIASSANTSGSPESGAKDTLVDANVEKLGYVSPLASSLPGRDRKTRLSWASTWAVETGLLIFATAIIVAILCLLAGFNRQVVPDWKYSINLNTLAAILSTILRASLVSIAESGTVTKPIPTWK
jgi:hypothetical protein